ncbi:MAG: hypoxanthine phosphoribosyltransferase, partial [Synergistetes bacterium]|nr:hypoxanthine phosphoribosyltransferase [Synergistota bacterium]
EDKDPVLIGILKGAIPFMADLLKNIHVPVRIDFMAVSSYGNSTESTGNVKILKDLDKPIRSQNIIIVEDIIDTGFTIDYLLKTLRVRKPKSIKVCALLSKPERRIIKVPIDYKGFDIPNKFVIGYGLDYAEHYRNLPYIAVLKPEVYE